MCSCHPNHLPPSYEKKSANDLTPIGSMGLILIYIYHRNQPNVGKYTKHGSYETHFGLFFCPFLFITFQNQNKRWSQMEVQKSCKPWRLSTKNHLESQVSYFKAIVAGFRGKVALKNRTLGFPGTWKTWEILAFFERQRGVFKLMEMNGTTTAVNESLESWPAGCGNLLSSINLRGPWNIQPHQLSKKKTSWWFWTNPSEKYAIVQMGSSSPIFGVKIPKIFELPPPSHGWL